MTIPIPVRGKVRTHIWIFFWKLRRKLRSYKRNPDCNEKRRYKNDTNFVLGPHTHVDPLYQGGHKFDMVKVPFEPFRFESTRRQND